MQKQDIGFTTITILQATPRKHLREVLLHDRNHRDRRSMGLARGRRCGECNILSCGESFE